MIYLPNLWPLIEPIGFPFLPGSWNPSCGEIGIHPTITGHIERALPRLCEKEPISFEESEALAIVYHQLLHSCGDQDFSGYEYDIRRRFEIELVNEMHARLTFDSFISDLGFDPELVCGREVEQAGRYYGGWVLPFREVLQTVGVTREEARIFFERLNYGEPTRTYFDEMIKLIGDRLGSDEYEREELRRTLLQDLRGA
jgi:hypothetical protein